MELMTVTTPVYDHRNRLFYKKDRGMRHVTWMLEKREDQRTCIQNVTNMFEDRRMVGSRPMYRDDIFFDGNIVALKSHLGVRRYYLFINITLVMLSRKLVFLYPLTCAGTIRGEKKNGVDLESMCINTTHRVKISFKSIGFNDHIVYESCFSSSDTRRYAQATSATCTVTPNYAFEIRISILHTRFSHLPDRFSIEFCHSFNYRHSNIIRKYIDNLRRYII